MVSFNKIHAGLDVLPAQIELAKNVHLFDEFSARRESGPVHADMTDIWVRYGDLTEMLETGDFSEIADEHDSIWLKDLPAIKRLCFEVMTLVDGERLGGVLITKIPPGGEIKPHRDSGWHAEYYDKYYIPIVNKTSAVFGFDEGLIYPDEGDVWAFDNSYQHWVVNGSGTDRIALIICIKQSKYTKGGELQP